MRDFSLTYPTLLRLKGDAGKTIIFCKKKSTLNIKKIGNYLSIYSKIENQKILQ